MSVLYSQRVRHLCSSSNFTYSKVISIMLSTESEGTAEPLLNRDRFTRKPQSAISRFFCKLTNQPDDMATQQELTEASRQGNTALEARLVSLGADPSSHQYGVRLWPLDDQVMHSSSVADSITGYRLLQPLQGQDESRYGNRAGLQAKSNQPHLYVCGKSSQHIGRDR